MKKPALLTVALAFLALFFGWETHRAWRSSLPAGDNGTRIAPASWQPVALAPDPPPPPEVAPLISAVTARPLFRADRKPFGDPGSSLGRNYDTELSRFSLIGIMVIGDDQMGIVVSKSGNRSDRWEVKAGDTLPGFKVKEVRNDGLAVTADNREFLLPMYAGPPTAQAGGPIRTDVQRRETSPASTAAPPPAGQATPPQRAIPAPTPPPAIQGMPQPTPEPTPPGPRSIRGRRQ